MATTQFCSRCTSIVNSSKLTARRAVRADRSSWPLGRQILRRFAPQDELKGRHNVLSLSRSRPPRAARRDT